MKRFYDDQRVVVTAGDLVGRKGCVVRLRRCDDGAWVDMDEDLPEHLQEFPPGDRRARHVLLYPWLCEPAPYDGVVRPGGPALHEQSSHYPAEWGGRVPRTVRTPRPVHSDVPYFCVGGGLHTEAVGVYPAWTNCNGAVSAVLPGGRALGLRPGEFEVVEWYEPGEGAPREGDDEPAPAAPPGAGPEA